MNGKAAGTEGQPALAADDAVLAVPLDKGGAVQFLPLGDLRDVLLDFRDDLTEAGEAFQSHRQRDGGRAGYAHLTRALQVLADRLPWLCSDQARAALTRLLADLHDVQTGRSKPKAFEPFVVGAVSPSPVAWRNTAAAAAVELLVAAGDPLQDAAARVARTLTDAGHTRDVRGPGARHDATITADTVIGWRKACRRRGGGGAHVMPQLFQEYTAAADDESRRAKAKEYLERLARSADYADLRDRE